MPVERYEGEFHQSQLNQYMGCARAFYYTNIKGYERERVNMANLGGRAGHSTLEYAHTQDVWNGDELFAKFQKFLALEIADCLQKGMEIDGEIVEDDYYQMICGYAGKLYNQYLEVLLMEDEFKFMIKPSSAEYFFAGRIDQLGRVRTELMFDDFPWLRRQNLPEFSLLHRDTKFGRKQKTSPFELGLNLQIDVYSLALKIGTFDEKATRFGLKPVNPDTLLDRYRFDLLPHFHILYYLRDHIKPKSENGYYVKDDDDNILPCPIIEAAGDGLCMLSSTPSYCQGARNFCPFNPPAKSMKKDYGNYIKGNDSKNQICRLAEAGPIVITDPATGAWRQNCVISTKENFCKGQREYCFKRPRKRPALYFTQRPASFLEEVPKKLGAITASIRMGHYPRHLNDLCYNFCQHRAVCEVEALTELDLDFQNNDNTEG